MQATTELRSWGERAAPPGWWAFYVRVTREESVTADLSIPNQVGRAREVAALRGWSDYKIYVEPKHVSAKLWADKRPALKELLDDVAAGRIRGACARHTDRLWRNNDIQARLLGALRPHKVELWDFAHQYDYRSAHERFSLQVLGAASELEVNLTAERIREMKRGKATKGMTGGGPPPFGYTSQSWCIHELGEAGQPADEAYRQACLKYPVGKCWYIDEKEAEVVRLIFELYTSPPYRYGCKRIVRHLNERGYKTRRGCAWLSNYVNKIINNPAYGGFTTYDQAAYDERLPSRLPRYKQTLFKGEHEPIVAPEIWQKAQQIKATENTVKRQRSGPKANETFSLTGILRCPSCGSRMIGKWSHHSTRRYYICSRRHSGGADDRGWQRATGVRGPGRHRHHSCTGLAAAGGARGAPSCSPDAPPDDGGPVERRSRGEPSTGKPDPWGVQRRNALVCSAPSVGDGSPVAEGPCRRDVLLVDVVRVLQRRGGWAGPWGCLVPAREHGACRDQWRRWRASEHGSASRGSTPPPGRYGNQSATSSAASARSSRTAGPPARTAIPIRLPSDRTAPHRPRATLERGRSDASCQKRHPHPNACAASSWCSQRARSIPEASSPSGVSASRRRSVS
jgi:DNA invertase Pin-like site-specific DNA recombinase